MRSRQWLVFGAGMLIVGFVSTWAAAWAQGNSSSSPAAYLGLAFTVAGFIFAAGGWVSTVRNVVTQSRAHHRTLHGDNECGGLVAEVHSLQMQANQFITETEFLAKEQDLLARFDQRCAAHSRDWREELERSRQEAEKRWDEQTRRIDSALAAMQTLVRAVEASARHPS